MDKKSSAVEFILYVISNDFYEFIRLHEFPNKSCHSCCFVHVGFDLLENDRIVLELGIQRI